MTDTAPTPAAAPVVTERVVTREVPADPPLDPQFGVTEPAKPKDHFFLVADPDASDGFRKVNAWGEEKGSPEDKKRWA